MSELLRALSNRSLSTEDRLKVACYLWKQEGPQLAENRAVLAKWISEELSSAYGKKVRTRPPPGVRCNLWMFLSLVLHTDCQNEGGFQPSITTHLLQCMSEVCTEVGASGDDEVLQCACTEVGASGDDEVLQCARNMLKSLESILSLSPRPAVLYKYELMVSLLVSLTNLALSNLTSGHEPVEELFPSLNCFLKHYTYLQGTQGNHKKVFTATCNQLLEPVLQLKYRLSAPSPPSVVTEVIGHLDETLSSLFTCDTLMEFTSAVSETGKGSAAVSYARVLFERLEKLLEPSTRREEIYQATVVGVAAIYEAFLSRNSKEKQVSRDVEFQFFSKLLRLLGCAVCYSPTKATDQLEELEFADGEYLEEDRDKDASAGPVAGKWQFVLSRLCSQMTGSRQRPSNDHEGVADVRGSEGGATKRHEEVADVRGHEGGADATGLSPEALATLAKCLTLLLEYGVYQAAEDFTAGGRQSSQLQLLSVNLLQGVNPHNLSGVFGCLHAVLKLNHKILEPLLPVLLVIVITWQHQTFNRGMNLFTHEVIDVYFKLRQFPLLLEKLLSSLDTVYHLRLSLLPSPPLTPQAEHRLAGKIQELPPGQCIEILETLCQAFEDSYFSRIKLLPASGPPRKKKKRDRSATPVNTTTTNVHSESLVAVTQRFVDLFAIVVSHTPLEVWGGRHKGRALAVLRKMRDGICHPFLDTCPTVAQNVQSPLCSASLHLAVKCTELEVGLRTVFPDLLPSDSSLVTLSWQPSPGRMMIPVNWDGLIEGPLDTQCEYLMRKLAVLQLRFSPRDGEVTPSESELLKFVFEASPPPILTDAVWSGQLLAISADNAYIATWGLLLSQLPLLYELCSESHLKKVAGFVLQTMLSAHEAGSDTTQVLAGEGLTCGVVVGSLVNSTGFQEMRKLHESLLESCLSHAASTFPRRFPRELKEALMQCTTGVIDPSPEALHTAFVCILRQCSEQPDSADHPSLKRSKRIRKWLNQLSAYRELMQALPLAAMHTGIIQRGLLAVAVCCVSLTHLMHLDSVDLLLPTLANMQYLLAWLLHSLTKCPKDSKPSQRVVGIRSGIPVEALLQWAYTAARYRSKSSEGMDSAVLASSLVLVEIVFKIALQCGNYPSKFVKLVGSEVSGAIKRKESYWDSFIAENCLKVAVNHTCKHLSELSPKHQHVETLRAALDQLLETVLKILGRISREESNCDPYTFPAIVSAFVTILHCREDLVSSRSAEFAGMLLLQAQHVDTAGHKGATLTAGQLEKLFAMVDALSLPAAFSKSAVELKLPQELALLPSWSRLQQILEFLLEKVGYQHGATTLVEKQSGVSSFDFGGMVGRETKEVAGTILAKVTQTMSGVLAAASREEIASVFEHVSEQDFKSAVSVNLFCCCWNVILDSRLSQDSRRELRRWLTKVLLKCMSIVHRYQGNAVVLSKAVYLATRLVAIPSQVGLDSRSVMMSLRLCSSLDSCSETELVRLGDDTAQLLSAVVRNHAVVATSCPAPIFSTVNKLINVAVKEGQAIQIKLLDNQHGSASEALSLRINSAVQFAGQTTRVMEALSNHKVLTKYATYPIGEFIVVSSTLPVHASVKKALLPGVFSLLKLCSEQDTTFIQASLDASMQDTFKTVLAEYKKFHRFSGRI